MAKDPRYPGKRYHPTKGECYVQSADDDMLLGPGWSDDPDATTKKPKKAEKSEGTA